MNDRNNFHTDSGEPSLERPSEGSLSVSLISLESGSLEQGANQVERPASSEELKLGFNQLRFSLARIKDRSKPLALEFSSSPLVLSEITLEGYSDGELNIVCLPFKTTACSSTAASLLFDEGLPRIEFSLEGWPELETLVFSFNLQSLAEEARRDVLVFQKNLIQELQAKVGNLTSSQEADKAQLRVLEERLAVLTAENQTLERKYTALLRERQRADVELLEGLKQQQQSQKAGAKESSLPEAQCVYSELRNQCSQLEHHLKVSEDRKQHLEEVFDSVTRSFSWRITRPIRLGASLLRSAKK